MFLLMQAAQPATPVDMNIAASDDLLESVNSQSTDEDIVEASQVDDVEYFDTLVDLDEDLDNQQPPDSDVESDRSSVSFILSSFVLINLTMKLLN